MKKFLILCLALFMGTVALADDKTEVLNFFNSYVNAANNFDNNLFTKYYVKNPTIYRVVVKPDGTKHVANVPFSIYLKESSKGKAFGKMIRYKNYYSNIKITQNGNDYKVSAIRKPTPGGSFPAYFIIGKDNYGAWKIKVESMNTPRKEFLR